MSRQQQHPNKRRKKVQTQSSSSIVTVQDLAELKRHYRFIPDDDNDKPQSKWQHRMTQHYQSHLYRDYVLADLTRAHKQKLGLRWRTAAEVQMEKGSRSCGNKHCPVYNSDDWMLLSSSSSSLPSQRRSSDNDTSELRRKARHKIASSSDHYFALDPPQSEAEEIRRVKQIPHGQGIASFEVPFTYCDDDHTIDDNDPKQSNQKKREKTELVQCVLCLRCAPKLFLSQQQQGPSSSSSNRSNKPEPYLAAWKARQRNNVPMAGSTQSRKEKVKTKRNYKR